MNKRIAEREIVQRQEECRTSLEDRKNVNVFGVFCFTKSRSILGGAELWVKYSVC